MEGRRRVLSRSCFVVNNTSRPVLNPAFMALPREQQYLATTAPSLYLPLAQIASDIAASSCDQVGIKLDYDDPEYALWILLRNRGYQGRIDHAFVENDSERIRRNPLKACAALTSAKNLPASVTAEFPRQSHYDRFTLLWAIVTVLKLAERPITGGMPEISDIALATH